MSNAKHSNTEKLKNGGLSAKSALYGAEEAAAATIATIALPLANFSFGFAATIRSQRTAYVHFFLKLAFLISAHITSVALVWLDRRSFAPLATGFTFCLHNKASYKMATTRVTRSFTRRISERKS